MVGTAAIAALSAWGPAPGDSAADRLRTQAAIRDSLVAFVDSKGMVWFASAPMADICAAASDASNSTYSLGVRLGGAGCGAAPGIGAASASVSFKLGLRTVTLTGWSSAGA
ncbi:MAG: hypothetical protein KGI26_05065 [Thaumarchaeota archaeon]|nr:hypothetical protein [Nitrososphaerota archaeon]